MGAKESKTRIFSRLDSPLGIDIMNNKKKMKAITTVKKIYAIKKSRITSNNEAIEVLDEYAQAYLKSKMPDKDELLTLIKQSLKHGFNSYEAAEAGLEAFKVDVEANWILHKYLKSLPQEREEDVKIKVPNSIKNSGRPLRY